MMTALQNESFSEQSQHLAGLNAAERVRWAHETYGDQLVMSTSFGVQSAVMLHLVTSIIPEIPILFVDTGYLFPETYRFAEDLKKRLNLNLKIYTPQLTAAYQEAIHGKLWEQGPEALEQYNLINKVEPMNRAISEHRATAWLSGLRRVQSSTRQNLEPLERQNKIIKIYPILEWSEREIYQYLQKYDLPYHPLWEQGYISIGDVHSTRKLGEGMTADDTRFNGMKRECGLHESTREGMDFQI